MDSEVQRGMESIKSENQAGSALIPDTSFLGRRLCGPCFGRRFFSFYQE